jgi:predicted 2-oxoglutarate/Fe(II)-dependent dioxygenase YbiX
LGQHPQFLSAALPVTIHPPRFNLYRDGGHYGAHVDGALMHAGRDRLLRTDLSATLFLNDPADYDGGELTIEGQFGGQSVKLPPEYGALPFLQPAQGDARHAGHADRQLLLDAKRGQGWRGAHDAL